MAAAADLHPFVASVLRYSDGFGDGGGDGVANNSDFPQDQAGCNSVDCAWREGQCVPGEMKGRRPLLTDHKTFLTSKCLLFLSLTVQPKDNQIPKIFATKDLKVEVCQ